MLPSTLDIIKLDPHCWVQVCSRGIASPHSQDRAGWGAKVRMAVRHLSDGALAHIDLGEYTLKKYYGQSVSQFMRDTGTRFTPEEMSLIHYDNYANAHNPDKKLEVIVFGECKKIPLHEEVGRLLRRDA